MALCRSIFILPPRLGALLLMSVYQNCLIKYILTDQLKVKTSIDQTARCGSEDATLLAMEIKCEAAQTVTLKSIHLYDAKCDLYVTD